MVKRLHIECPTCGAHQLARQQMQTQQLCGVCGKWVTLTEPVTFMREPSRPRVIVVDDLAEALSTGA